MIEAITFDFWNTLYQSPGRKLAETRSEDVREVLLAGGHVFSDDQVRAAFQQTGKEAFDRQRNEGIDIGPWGHIELIVKNLDISVSDDGKEKLYQAYTGALIKIPPWLNDDVLDTLPLLAQRFKLAVICNTGVTPGITLRKLLADDGISKYFLHTTFSDETGFSKPDPRIFHCTLEQLQVTSSRAVHIGDDAITDVQGSKRAGMTSVWLAPDASQVVPEADYHVRRVKELLNLF